LPSASDQAEDPPVLDAPLPPVSVPDRHPGEDFAIRVEGLSLVYRTTLESRPTLRGSLRRLGRRERVVREIQALQDVSFSVPHGKVLGVVGANGAGKSTLMRAVAGILPPTEGRIEVHGRVSTLLALGVGFNRELTGRQNVVLGGLAAGLSREQLAAKYEKIVRFAELRDFMDLPMRTYSSGMYGRLAFSVAVNMDPNILLIDEALSVGDARFRKKSFRKMRQLCRGGRTILLVSHSMASIRDLCDEAIWMHQGRLRMWDEPGPVISAYTQYLDVSEDDPETLDDV
jgi:ABC-type polysaccharide/polyol phosphate transport system ATPase subunit